MTYLLAALSIFFAGLCSGFALAAWMDRKPQPMMKPPKFLRER